jgi:hypothetical protein
MSTFRYGVFQVGQIWMVADEAGSQLGFPSRDLAIGAVCVMVALHRAAFETALVTIQDEHGALRTVLNPVDCGSLVQVANHNGWDVAFGSTALASQPVSASASP